MNQQSNDDLLHPFEAPAVEREESFSRSNLQDGIACCLSGGGFRAMVFHLGFLWRLNELRILKETKRFSSVSGGSITSALLGMTWNDLNESEFSTQAFKDLVVQPLLKLATQTIDVSAVGWGTLNPFSRISDQVADAYADHLFGDKTLQDLPDEPRWVINATNVKSGALWRFSKPYMGDYRVGLIRKPSVRLADAVAASSAFPPFLSPMVMDIDEGQFAPEVSADLTSSEYRRGAVLTDGGVYDNLGLETSIKRYRTLLVSDGGRGVKPDPSPKEDWAQHSHRMIDLLQQQISNLRRRQLIAELTSGTYSGAYCGIETNIANMDAAHALPVERDAQLELANIPTRLAPISDTMQERLINLAYAISDAAVRKYMMPEEEPPVQLPFPDSGI